MMPPMDSVASNPDRPAEVDVVIIGGGIVGAATAFFLRRQGRSVLLCEKGIIGGEQSGRNLGWCRTLGRDLRELPLMLEAMEIWDRSEELLGHRVGGKSVPKVTWEAPGRPETRFGRMSGAIWAAKGVTRSCGAGSARLRPERWGGVGEG